MSPVFSQGEFHRENIFLCILKSAHAPKKELWKPHTSYKFCAVLNQVNQIIDNFGTAFISASTCGLLSALSKITCFKCDSLSQ